MNRAFCIPHFIALAFAAAALAEPTSRPSLSSSPAANALLGNPSHATTSVKDKDNYLMTKPFYVLSYNSEAGEPNWVSWVLTKDDVGDAPRKRTFDTDSTLPIGFRRAKAKDYTNGGFDRGHMCPHSDRAANQDESYSTFVMTNIIPQAPNVNQKAWAQLEDYERAIAIDGNHVYITSGPCGRGGVGSNGVADTVGGDHPVAVPAKCWKIIVIVPEAGGDDDLKKITAKTRVITVMMPNDNSKVGDEWAKYRTSVKDVEKQTGLTFFDRVAPDVATALKAEKDSEWTPKPVAKHFGD